MIKKIFLGFIVLFVGFISFSNAGYVRKLGDFSTSLYNSNYDNNILKYGSFLTNFIGYGKPILYLNDNFVWFWHYNSDLGFNSIYSIIPGNQGFVNNYVLCDELTGGSEISNLTYMPCGSPVNISSDTQNVFYNFFNTVTVDDYYFVDVFQTSNTVISNLCISSHIIGKSICFGNCRVNSSYYSCSPVPGDNNHNYGNTFNSLGYSGVFSYIDTSGIGSSPGVSSSNNSTGSFDGGVSLESVESSLLYFEDYYGWDESICYAGIDSLSYLYGQNGVSFQKGKGLSIFDVFSGIYGNSDLDKVYVWLNSQLLNYEQWFDRDGDPMYLSEYNSGTNQVDLFYDNLSFPFANKPVAFYFLADNIESYSTYSTMGSSVVSYCNIKINSGSFDDIIDQADKNNITKYTENYNTNQGLNPDGTNKEYGAWLSSGTEIAFSGNTSIKNSLKNFFDTINENINVSEGTSTLQILPTWLLSALMFVILFKFLRKR